MWLFWRERDALGALPAAQGTAAGGALMIMSLLLHALGRSQDIWIFEVGSLLGTLSAVLLFYKGVAAIKLVAIQLALLAFLIPLPGALVASLTGPLKTGVSAVAANLLYLFDYPIGRTGVLLTVGQYQLLVADACAGLNSVITLEAIGLIYMKLVAPKRRAHNIILAILLIPISFLSNVTRVVILVLVTYHFGDEAGQGFIHNAAGIVLFIIATALMILSNEALEAGFKLSRKLCNKSS